MLRSETDRSHTLEVQCSILNGKMAKLELESIKATETVTVGVQTDSKLKVQLIFLQFSFIHSGLLLNTFSKFATHKVWKKEYLRFRTRAILTCEAFHNINIINPSGLLAKNKEWNGLRFLRRRWQI